MREEDVSAEQPEALEEARLPYPDAQAGRSRGDRAPTPQGPGKSLRLIWRVRDPATFRALSRARRRRSGAVECRALDLGAPACPPRVAFAVGKPVGNAVARNRVRRRLRAVVREERTSLRAGWAYLFRAHPDAVKATYADLVAAVRDCLDCDP
jgi:ribonuclease P protein component